MKYKSITSFYGSVSRPLAYDETGERRYFTTVHEAVQEALRLKEEGPFSLVTVVELVQPGEEPRAAPPIYWTPPPPKEAPDPADLAKQQARQALQEDVMSALINFGSKKGDAIAIAKALPIDITELSPALNWAMRRK